MFTSIVKQRHAFKQRGADCVLLQVYDGAARSRAERVSGGVER